MCFQTWKHIKYIFVLMIIWRICKCSSKSGKRFITLKHIYIFVLMNYKVFPDMEELLHIHFNDRWLFFQIWKDIYIFIFICFSGLACSFPYSFWWYINLSRLGSTFAHTFDHNSMRVQLLKHIYSFRLKKNVFETLKNISKSIYISIINKCVLRLGNTFSYSFCFKNKCLSRLGLKFSYNNNK